jgi:predicted metal-dependent phosphoesterase TrpH
MRSRTTPLLCELHAHSAWSDGDLTLTDLVDLYGRNGFDVLCVTDHVGRTGWTDPRWRVTGPPSFADYLAAIEREAERAKLAYGLLVVPGLELTYDDDEPLNAAHAVAVGLRTFVEMDDGFERALTHARSAGAALIAAHPYDVDSSFGQRRRAEPDGALGAVRATARWAAGGHALADLVDRYELVNRRDVFPWVAEAGLPGVASGDFHRLEHLNTWKTLLPCARTERDVVDYLRSGMPVYLVDLAEPARIEAAA